MIQASLGAVQHPRVMVLKKVSRILKKLGGFAGSDPRSLEEWIERHRPTVERDVLRVLPHLPEDGRFVDVGANVGLFTECVLVHRPRCEAILFEPVSRLYENCQQRFADNPRVTVHQKGLGNEAGMVKIFKAQHNFGANSVMEDIMFDRRDNSEVRSDTVIETEQIEVVVFSEFAREHGIGDVDLVKTDTEGFDFAVLEGMLDWLAERERLPVILSELLARDYHPRWAHQERVLTRLFDLGYEKVDLTHMKKVEDILFLPEQGSPQR